MRHVVLSDDGYSVSPDAAHRMMAACFFPDSVRDQVQGMLIARIEQNEFRKVGAANYRPSEIMLVASRLIEKRTAQLYAVGFIAHAYLWLSRTPYRPSLNRASIIASYSVGEFNKITYRPGLDPEGDDKSQPVTDDPATLERIFRRYRSVAHICAARVSASGYLDHAHIWDESPPVTEVMIQTAVSIQDALEKITNTSTWDLWDLKRHYPASLSGSAVLNADQDLLAWIGRGYDLALKEGKIVNPDAGGR